MLKPIDIKRNLALAEGAGAASGTTPAGGGPGGATAGGTAVGVNSTNKDPNLQHPPVEDLDDDENSLYDPNKPTAGSLYVAPIEHYVDDGELYQQKYNDYSRIKYWEFLLDHPRRPKLPPGHESWSQQGGNNYFPIDILQYSTFDKYLLACTVHLYWDYAYLYLFSLFILLVTVYYDSLVREYILIPSYLLYFPLLLMVITQLIPLISIIYLVTKCNDLVKLVASRTFGSWVLTPTAFPLLSHSSSPIHQTLVCRLLFQC